MSFNRVEHQSRPLLPDELEARVLGGLKRGAGYVLVALAVAGWLSLITWSAQDPSLTHATSALTRNWLGPIGAIVSDLLLQTIGFAAIFPFLCIAWIGLELITMESTRSLRIRAWLMPVAILALAAGLSALPAPVAWPLNHGLGGMLGDIGFGLVSGLLAIINPARAGAVTGLLMLSGGAVLLCTSMNLSTQDFAAIFRLERPITGSRLGKPRPILQLLGAFLSRKNDRAAASADHQAGAGGSHEIGRSRAAGPYQRPWFADAPEPALERPVAPSANQASAVAASASRGGDAFDQTTDIASKAIAKRFAPAVDGVEDGPRLPGFARKATEQIGGLMALRPSPTEWRRPSLNFLKKAVAQRPAAEFSQSVLRGNARLLEDVLTNFTVKGEVKDIKPGPVVTLFEFEPARGTKSSRVIALADDVAREMSATSARIAIIPGRNAMGIELPNARRETVYLRELLESEAWRTTDAHLPVILGKGIGGEPVIADLARMPHLLVAGTTGSGKSVGVNAMILSLLYRLSPAECRLIMIDPKMLELSVYNGIPHLLAPVVTDPHQAAGTLAWAVSEMEERYKRMAQLGVRNIEIFNNRVRNAKKRGEMVGRTVHTGYDQRTGEALYEKDENDFEPMPFIVIVVDEFADLMVVAGKEVEGSVQRLAQMARAAGIHLIMATQRPSVDVVTGTIKANFPTRIAFKVASKIDSRTILNDQGAEQLLGAGDMLYSAGTGQITRVHGPFVSDEEVERVATALREAGAPRYVESLIRAAEAGTAGAAGSGTATADREGGADGSDDLYDRAVAIVHRDQKASTSYLQRRLSIGYNRAADLIERMEKDGVVSSADAVGRRRVLIGQGQAAETAE